MDPTAPLTVIAKNGGYSNRCAAVQALSVALIPDSRWWCRHRRRTTGTLFVGADGTTLIEGDAFARCSAGSVPTAATSKVYGSILCDGLGGAAGGSGLSTLGGVLRVNELGAWRPDQPRAARQRRRRG